MPGLPFAETIPPGDAFELKTPESASTSATLAKLQSYVTYTAPFNVTKTTTVRYYTTDGAGTAETSKSQQIRIDAAPPTAALTSRAAGSYRRNTSITVRATVTDNGTGGSAASGVARVVFRDGNSRPRCQSVSSGSPGNLGS